MTNWAEKRASFSFRYFTYPKIVVGDLSPSSGPIFGGTRVRLLLSDWEGPRTRAGAGLPNLGTASADLKTVSIVMVTSNSSRTAASFTVTRAATTSAAQAGLLRQYTILFELPRSPLGTEGLARIELRIDGEAQDLDDSIQSLDFEFVGTQIRNVVPNSAYLNPGSGGAAANVVVSNLGRSNGLEVTITADRVPCEILSVASRDSDFGVDTIIAIKIPELPYQFVGQIPVTVKTLLLEQDLIAQFQYILPPEPFVDSESVLIDGNERLWAASGRQGHGGVLSIRNLVLAFGWDFDECTVNFGQRQGV
eukprot:583119-Rhodomonas_salina.1